MTTARVDWTIPEIEEIFHLPLLDLIARAQEVHRAHHDPHVVRVNQLISIKTGGCPEDSVIAEMDRQLGVLEQELAKHFEVHPDAEIITSLPGLGLVIGARVLGEFGDDPNRYLNAKSRRNYAGTSPITKASGKLRFVNARYIGNRHLADACYWWAFCSLNRSPGARKYYDDLRKRKVDHDAALRALANRLVGILDGCLRHRTLYDEEIAWGHRRAA